MDDCEQDFSRRAESSAINKTHFEQFEVDDMKRISLVLTLTLAAAVAVVTVASAKPDFSGNWSMDRARSFGMPPNMQQTMVVTHKGDSVELETKLIQPNNERVVKDSYMLDGKEHEFQPPAPPNAPKDAPLHPKESGQGIGYPPAMGLR